MSRSSTLRIGYPAALVLLCTLVWALSLLVLGQNGRAESAQLTSNVGLAVIAFTAGFVSVRQGMTSVHLKGFWYLIGCASLSWSAGQVVSAWYESGLDRQVPRPSFADVGYLGLPPLAAAALFCLPLAAPTLAGRARTVLDGVIVALSMLLVSWVLVLGPVLRAGSDSTLATAISLAYPAGDTVVITIVVVTWLRARQSADELPVSLTLVGAGLVAFAVSDAGLVYLTTAGQYSSGNVIDIGWFVGFALLAVAALRARSGSVEAFERGPLAHNLGTFLPYSAVTVAIATSVFDLIRRGTADTFVSWDRSALMVFLVARQVLTLRENLTLTRDLEDRVRTRTAELQASRERFAALAQHSSDVVTVIDVDGLITYQSESCARVLDRDPVDMTGTCLWDYMADDHATALRNAIASVSVEPLRLQTLHSTWTHADGTPCHLEVTVTNLLENDNVAGLVLNSRDVTDRTALEQQLLHQAFHDSLTGLFNRAMFKERLEHALARRWRRTDSLAILFLDLDGFKEVNDTLGHSTGDTLLVQVAERLACLVRGADTVARFGGDEFAILVEDLVDPTYTVGLAQRINTALQEPYDLAGSLVHLSVSVGIAHDTESASDAEQLLRNADLAMYQAKAARAGGYAIYDPSMHAGLVERVRLESDLRAALTHDRLSVHYQPLISMSTGSVTGVEALARWSHPERGHVSPAEFVPLAESTGLIRRLGEWILREACTQVVSWQQTNPELADMRISVNVSPGQLDDGNLAAVVNEVLTETRLAPARLTLEMTESVLMSDSPATLTTLRALRELGVRLAIDDFGTGYSSLSYLHRFPVDVLKIDRSFIEQLSRGGDVALVSTIVRLGHAMNLETVAEGIERPDEMLLLRRQGCTTGQGYHFSPPLPADELFALLTERVPLSLVSGSGGGMAPEQLVAG